MEFFKKIFSVNLKDYSNIAVDFPINIFLGIIAVSIAILGFVIGAKNSATALSVKQLLRHGAFGEENAKSLKELGLHNSRGARRALSGEGRLRRTVKRAGEKALTFEEYSALSRKERKAALKGISLEESKFYIEEERRADAEHIFKTLDTSPIKSLLGALLIISISFVLMIFMSDILTLLNEVMAKK